MSAWASGAIDRISEHANLCVLLSAISISRQRHVKVSGGGKG
jgi:hypothetical protein